MSKHDVVIRQLLGKDSCSGLYMNVDADEYGYLQVWGGLRTYKEGKAHPSLIFVLIDTSTYGLIVFENEEFAKEWFEENSKNWSRIFMLQDCQLREVKYVTEVERIKNDNLSG